MGLLVFGKQRKARQYGPASHWDFKKGNEFGRTFQEMAWEGKLECVGNEAQQGDETLALESILPTSLPYYLVLFSRLLYHTTAGACLFHSSPRSIAQDLREAPNCLQSVCSSGRFPLIANPFDAFVFCTASDRSAFS
jgi:hypothetical protein